MNLPLSMKMTRSAISRAKPIWWVTITMVMPSAARFLMVVNTSPTSSGSSAEVGSSKSMSLGRMARARAMATRCFWPPERNAGIDVLLVQEPDPAQQVQGDLAGLFAGLLLHGDGPFHHVLQHGHVREEVEVLEDHADLGPEGADDIGLLHDEPALLVLAVSHFLAVHQDGALVHLFEEVDHPEQRRLARARRADDDDPLPLLDIEVHLVHSREAAEALDDSLKLYHRFS